MSQGNLARSLKSRERRAMNFDSCHKLRCAVPRGVADWTLIGGFSWDSGLDCICLIHNTKPPSKMIAIAAAANKSGD